MEATDGWALYELFERLPEDLHPLALQAHFPSIDLDHRLELATANSATQQDLGQVSMHGMPCLMEAVAGLTDLQSLQFGLFQCNIECLKNSEPFCTSFSNMLQSLVQLTSLRIGDKEPLSDPQKCITYSSLLPSVALCLARSLPSMTGLLSLTLQSMKGAREVDGWHKVLEALQSCSHLQHLCLSTVEIVTRSASDLAPLCPIMRAHHSGQKEQNSITSEALIRHSSISIPQFQSNSQSLIQDHLWDSQPHEADSSAPQELTPRELEHTAFLANALAGKLPADLPSEDGSFDATSATMPDLSNYIQLVHETLAYGDSCEAQEKLESSFTERQSCSQYPTTSALESVSQPDACKGTVVGCTEAEAFGAALAAMPGLRSLILSDIQVEEAALYPLTQALQRAGTCIVLQHLTMLSLSGSFHTAFRQSSHWDNQGLSAVLQHMTALQHIDLSFCGMCAGSAQLLAPAFHFLKQLRHIDVAYNSLSYGDLASFAYVWNQNLKHVSSLILNHAHGITDEILNDKCSERMHLIDAIGQLNTLQHLEMDSIHFSVTTRDDTSALALIHALGKLNSLTHLSLECFNWSNRSMHALVPQLANDKLLKSLRVNGTLVDFQARFLHSLQ